MVSSHNNITHLPPVPPQTNVFTIGTFNAESRLKLSGTQLVKQLQALDVDFCAVQDTGPPPHQFVYNKGGYEIINRPPPTKDKNAGLAILFKSTLKNTFSPLPEDKQPVNKRIWIIKALYPSEHHIYVVYNKNNCNQTMESLKLLDFKPRDILLGDLNSYSDKHMDFSTSASSPTNKNKFINYLTDNGWYDSFRHLYPHKKAYSRTGLCKPNKNTTYLTASRINHILVRSSNIDKLAASKIVQENTCDSDHRLVTLHIHSDNKAQVIENKNIQTRQGIKDKNKWKEFQRTLPPPTQNTNIEETHNNLDAQMLDHFDKVFPLVEINQKNWHREVFISKEYAQAKAKKKQSYKVYTHIKKVLTKRIEEEPSKLTEMIKQIGSTSIHIPSVYSEAALIAAHQCENEFNKQIRKILRKQRQKEIKKKVNKIINSIDENGHNLFKVLNSTESNQIACIFEEDKVITNPAQINNSLIQT